MSSENQIRANRENAQHSTGPTSETGRAASSKNHFRHGLTGNSFTVLDFEDQDEYDHVLCGLRFEHQPSTMTEAILVEKMAQSYWLSKRALYLQDRCATDPELTSEEQHKELALFIRYQTTHDRAFHRSLNDLLKLRAEKRKAEIGFESQKHKQADQHRREAAEKRRLDEAVLRQRAEDRRMERHKWDILLAEAKVDHQIAVTANLDLDDVIAEARENRSLEVKKAA
jgi:hypothetical protein